jgi:glycosyltransferase involved in cell wall biosynthesis
VAGAGRRLRVLVLSWNYPTAAAPQRGLWAERMTDAVSPHADLTAIVPVPWVPPLVPVEAIARFRRVPRLERRGTVDVHAPRVPGSIEYFTFDSDAGLSTPRLVALARHLHAERPFDLVHAHFIYPDGVVASRIGRALGIPVMTTEHAFWAPWLVKNRKTGAMVDAALPGIRLVTCVSEYLRDDVQRYIGDRAATAVLPNVVDDMVFHPVARDRDVDELLYVGLIRRVKRVDVLLRALADVRRAVPSMRLRILSSTAFKAYGADRKEVFDLVGSLGLTDAVRVEHGADPPAVAEAMRRCAMVVVSAQRETFCSVAAEALACGTPLVTTRCGGPEEFVTEADGALVPVDDPAALAAAILRVRAERSRFDERAIAARIVNRFGRAAWSARALSLYEQVVSSRV